MYTCICIHVGKDPFPESKGVRARVRVCVCVREKVMRIVVWAQQEEKDILCICIYMFTHVYMCVHTHVYICMYTYIEEVYIYTHM